MTLTLTKEQVERLHPVARHLERAVKNADLIGITATECRTILWPVYKEVYGAEPGNVYCNACIFTACQKLGRLYLAAEQGREATKEPVSAPQTPEVVNTATPKEKTPQKAKNDNKKKTTKK